MALTDTFFESKQIAIIGLSRDEKSFSQAVYRELLAKGYELFPVNPSADKIGDIDCYSSIENLPEGIKTAYVVTSKTNTAKAVEELSARGFDLVWIQKDSDDGEPLESGNTQLIRGKCIFMYIEPVKSVHAFHRFLAKLFGTYSK